MLVTVDSHAHIRTLMEDILCNPNLLDGMHVDTLRQLTSYAVEKGDFSVLSLITKLYTGIPSKNDSLPEWWLSDFHDDITKVKFEHQREVKEIRWCDVTLGDGELLTSEKHQPLLIAFKYWLIACDNPLENGGRLISSKFAMKKYNNILVLINAILLHGEALKLSEFHLLKATDAFWLGILTTITEHSGSIVNDLYQVKHRIKCLLDNVDVSQEDADAFTAKYPHVTRQVADDEVELNLKDRVKACCWLHQQRYYAQPSGDRYGHNIPKGRNSVLTQMIFNGIILPDSIKVSPFPELELKPTFVRTEYKSVPNKERKSGASKESLGEWVTAIKLINTNIDKMNSCAFNPVSSSVSADFINLTVSFRKQGRTKTLPPNFVCNLFRDSYTLLKQFFPAPNEKGENLWDNILELLLAARTKSSRSGSNPHRPRHNTKAFCEEQHRHLPQSELGHWLKFEAMDLVHSSFKDKGVQQFEGIFSTSAHCHKRIRNNESMLELVTVLQGAIQFLLGSIMARRVDEMLQLKPFGNLVFIDEHGNYSTSFNPFESDIERWSLKFKVKKTGIKGENLTDKRPIPLSIARFVWQLEQFNQQVIESGLAKESELFLFNSIGSQSFNITKGNENRINHAFDALCDYFETAIVEMDNGEYRRHYVRQHQLRRFFALVFFWSSGYENMEALRWMMAHSDLEHLHNYITDTVDGRIINSVKASVITDSITRKKSKIENSEELRQIIAKRLTGDSNQRLFISTLDDAIFDYEDESKHKTIPHISMLQAEQELESEVLTLLESGKISLDLKWEDAVIIDGEVVKSFNLILKVNELE
ncbi:integrase [Vibrio splendidus]|uniref:integrase n=1 Tax=Vibrio splendidus TaxID=29497 RepID=UPI003D0E71AB